MSKVKKANGDEGDAFGLGIIEDGIARLRRQTTP
jgi:hypothetical protein